MFLGAEEDIAAAQSLTGRRVVLRAYTYPSFGGDPWDEDGVRIIDAEEHLTPEQVAEILDLKRPPELDILPVTPKGEMYASTDGLVLGDIRYFGGKAANFGLLRRAIPANSPVSLALSFDLWLGFLEQTVEGGATLREHIDGVLARHTYPPSDMRALAEDLAGLRDLIKDRSRTVFTPGQEQAVLEALQDPRFGFDPERRLRFRSSTNVEDSAQFTGAGLYDSYSGCLADELAGGDGPSICDPSRPSRRGVFRAIRRVFASFYNDGAVLERLRHGLDEAGVGMALLVHHSFPDEIELANGVATLTRTSWSSQIHLVTQLGAVPVTASTSGAIPEEVRAHVSSFSTSVWLERSSNLVLLGQTVMEMDRDYRALADLLVAVAHRFNTETGRTAFVLDFEYKKVAPSGALVVKQVREIPQSSHVPSVTPFLLNEPMDLCVFQGESSNVFSLHRLKSHWRLETRSLWLTAESLAESFYTQARVQFTDGCGRLSFEGILPEFPSAKHAVEGFWVKDMWEFSGLTNPRSYELWTEVPGPVAPARCPIFTQRDLHRRVAVSHRDPVLAWDESVSPPGPSFTRTEECDLSGCFPLRPGDLPQTRNFRGKDGVAITTEFFWPPHPRGIVAGYTAPLARWRQTVIEGLTEAPIVLLGEYSQTYRPLHHNFDEHFVFVPSLEPGLDRDILDALRERDIVAIHAFTGMQEGGVIIYYSEAEMGQRCECSTPLFIRGDVNGDMAVDISDAVSLLYYLFAQGLPPHVPAAGDSNSDGAIDIGDALYLLNYLFAGGPAPAPPFPEPGCGDGRAGCLW